MNNWDNPITDQLADAFISLQSRGEAKKFLRDLLTEKEILEFANRWQVARMLNSRRPYSEIEKQTGMSSTTIARVSKFLNGRFGGYKLILNRLNNSHHHHVSTQEERS